MSQTSKNSSEIENGASDQEPTSSNANESKFLDFDSFNHFYNVN